MLDGLTHKVARRLNIRRPGAKAKADTAFVTIAYRELLGREPDPAGLANYLGMLRDGAGPGDVLTLLLDSDEYELHRAKVTDEQFVGLAYQAVLDRAPDGDGLAHQLSQLRGGGSHSDVIARLRASDEFRNQGRPGPLDVLHLSRVEWTRALPPARIIVDLGGASTSSSMGAMLQLGYPYPFDSLTIIDLPPEDRHSEFWSERYPDRVDTALGPVFYRHASMTDLSGIPDASVDLVNSGQTFEHIFPAEGESLLKEARRVLKPTGLLALDTPNRTLTAIQMRDEAEEFINPDHKIEYSHQQMVELFDRHGFDIVKAQGMAYMPNSVADDRFDLDEIVQHPGLYDDIDKCYLVAYLARPRL